MIEFDADDDPDTQLQFALQPTRKAASTTLGAS